MAVAGRSELFAQSRVRNLSRQTSYLDCYNNNWWIVVGNLEIMTATEV